MQELIEKLIENTPKIIESASRTQLSMIAFLVICISIIAIVFFSKDKSKLRFLVFAMLFAGITLLIFSFFKDQLINPIPKIGYTKKTPKVIGIYPKNIFGVNQKNGLISSLAGNPYGIEIIHLDMLSYDEMKRSEIRSLADTLAYLIKNDNILAISGPSITECTDDILRTIRQEDGKMPIFISSAAPRKFLNWDNYSSYINLYRISTGVDDRAASLANFLKNHSEIAETAILVEQSKTLNDTYGQIFLKEIIRKSNNFKELNEFIWSLA